MRPFSLRENNMPIVINKAETNITIAVRIDKVIERKTFPKAKRGEDGKRVPSQTEVSDAFLTEAEKHGVASLFFISGDLMVKEGTKKSKPKQEEPQKIDGSEKK